MSREATNTGGGLPRFFTISDIAIACQLTPETVRKIIKSGCIPATRIGSEWRIREADFYAYIKRRSTKGFK